MRIFVRPGVESPPPVVIARDDRSDLCSGAQILDNLGRVVATVTHSVEEGLTITPAAWCRVVQLEACEP